MDSQDNKPSSEAYCRKKWNILFDYVDERRDGILTLDEFLVFANRLVACGKEQLGRRLLSCYTRAWGVFCTANNLPRTTTSLHREEFIRGMQQLKVTEFFSQVYVPTLARVYFEVVDCNSDGLISLEEWRSFQKMRGNDVERSVQDTFKRLDRDSSGYISPDEILYAFTRFGLGEDPKEDFSFIYKIN